MLEAIVKLLFCSHFGQGKSFLVSEKSVKSQGILTLFFCVNHVCVFTAVKESVCIVILSLVSLAFSSANRMTVISASSTDAESLSLMILSSFLCTTAAATRVPSLEPYVYYVLSSGRERMYSSDHCFSISVPSLVQSIPHSYGSCSHGAVLSISSCVGSSNCLDTSR